MKKIKLHALALVLCGLFYSATIMAQGQTSDFKWVGNSLNDVLNSSDNDIKTFYLYNVGTGTYLNTGSYWGTSLSAFAVGMPLHIEASTGGTYKIQGPLTTQHGKYLGFPAPPSGSSGNQFDWDRIYCDRGIKNPADHVDWVITETSSGSKTYTLYIDNGSNSSVIGGHRYLKVKPTGTGRNTIEYPTSVNDEFGQWKFVTLKDLKDAFKAQFASNEAPADASFLIADQNFDVSNASVVKWITTGFSQKMGFNDYPYAFSPKEPYTFFVGCRSVLGDNYQRHYGSYWIGSVRNVGNNTNANGTMTQSVTTLKKGWYKVSCDGFYNAGSGSLLSASLFAKVQGTNNGESNVSTKLNQLNGKIQYTLEDLTKSKESWSASTGPELDINDKSPYVKAAELFEQGGYNNSILVYVPNDGNILDIGIKVEGSTHQLDWTAFDNFQLKYCGNNDLILDEMQESVNYMTKQANAANAYTLILKRTMTPGLWSSITLPVKLTAAQFKTAFGDQAKLSVLVGQDSNIPSRINFKSVSLANDNAIVICPNKLYIMKSTRNANVTSGSYTKTIAQGESITVQAPYFVINNVVLATTPSAIFKEDSKPSTTTDAKLQFCGTQINQTTNIVPANSYVLGANDGKWYFTQSALPIKGFRCWIATGNNAGTKDLKFFIDGVEEGETTGIEGLTFESTDSLDGTVYNINGQVVRRNATSLEGLPKGIYIINNKKYIVK
ncbi:MAG: adhesin [Prevotella sp.]|nr:adhesin [Prevotella sp.]